MRIFPYFFILFFSIQPLYADINFLTISDIHYGSSNKSGEGTDTGDALFAATMSKYTHLANQVDFILTLGDFPTHMIRTTPKKLEYIKTVFHELYMGDKAAKPLFYITGNNDSLIGNYQQFSSKDIPSPLTLAEGWQGACANCKGLIIDEKHMRDEGYYSSYVIPGNKDIILIALNSMQFAYPISIFSHYPSQEQEKDAQIQLSWLDTQLKTHQAKQLLIAMHIPPGQTYISTPFWRERYLNEFIKLLNQNHQRYGQITLLTAHTHMDDIRKIRLNEGNNIYAFAVPAVSRIHYNYPAMKIFDLDKNMQVKDYTTYYTSSDNQWVNEHYQATEHIFPQCKDKPLDKCLDTLTTELICNTFKTGQFYGAKGKQVDASICTTTYPIN